MKVAVLGAFGYQNTGDRLIALATKQLLLKRNPDCAVDLYSVRPYLLSSQPVEDEADMRYFSYRDKAIFETLQGYDALIIGGGGLLIPIRDFEPFLLIFRNGDAGRLPKAAWSAMGSQYTPTHDPGLSAWYAKVRTAAERLSYVSVRSDTTRRLLLSAGCPAESVRLVPDAVLGYAVPDSGRIQDSLRERYGLPANKRFIAVSVGPELLKPPLDAFLDALSEAIHAWTEANPGCPVVIVPFGQIYGDRTACAQLAKLVANRVWIDEPLSPEDLWCLIGMAEVYLTVRYHGLIAGIAQGVPTLILDCYLSNRTMSSKLRDLAVHYGLDDFYLSPIIGVCEPPETRSFLDIPGERRLANEIRRRIEGACDRKAEWARIGARARNEVDRHFDDMWEALGLSENSGQEAEDGPSILQTRGEGA
ncbi:polysaccharide pyruvyl transferase family protein [Gorillibacterium sp. sgz500922]|uniref:polysaccharide pyruvyl transferase family protein n=1 Tax=Gorillibacterium sp. sgz500922 TaxID=3446694 RepID=UPI003F672F33